MRRFPILTTGVALLTLAGLVVQETVPGTLGNLERTPAALHGEVWRWLTSLLVQDGHVAGGFFNLVGLALCGTAAEQVFSRRAWLAAYVGAGLVGQVFGQLWQPVGGGNSVAVCGLAALCVAALLRPNPPTRPSLVLFAPAAWCGSLASGLWPPALVVGVVLAGALNAPVRWPDWTRWLVPGFCAAVGLGLLLAQDLHGGGLVVALVVAVVADAVVGGHRSAERAPEVDA